MQLYDSKFLVIILAENVIVLNKTQAEFDFTAFNAILGINVNDVYLNVPNHNGLTSGI